MAKSQIAPSNGSPGLVSEQVTRHRVQGLIADGDLTSGPVALLPAGGPGNGDIRRAGIKPTASRFQGALSIYERGHGAAHTRNATGCDGVYEFMRMRACRTAVLIGRLATPVVKGSGHAAAAGSGRKGAHPQTVRRSLTVLAIGSAALLATGLLAGCGQSARTGASRSPATPSPSQATVTSASRAPGTRKAAGFEPAAVSFVSPTRGWVLGRSGCSDCAEVLVTGDGGVHWSVLPAPPGPLGYYRSSADAVMDIAFAGDANGFLYGPGLLATHDGGRSWTRQPLPPVQALSVGTGYVYALTRHGGSAGLWRTAIGASHWIRLPLPPGASPSASSGHGTQLYVEGSTLVLLRSGFTGPAVIPGQVGQLWVSSDGGTDWQARHVPCKPPEGGGAAVGSIALGHPGAWLLDCFNNEQSSQEQNTQHHLYGTSDAGLSWVRLSDPTRHNMPDLLADNGSGHAFLTTEGIFDTLVGTLDGGRHWHTVLRDGGSFCGWADLRFVNTDTGFVVGPAHYSREHLYRTDNGGRAWRVVHF